MNAQDELNARSRSQPLTDMAGGAAFVPRHAAQCNYEPNKLSARSTNASTKDSTPADATTSATDQRKLLIGQCNWILRFGLLGALVTFYRFHVYHLGRNTDRFVRKNSLADLGGDGQEIFNACCISIISN